VTLRYRVVRANEDGDIDHRFGLHATIPEAAVAAAAVRPTRDGYRGDIIDATTGRFVSWVAPA
jgi:hypothetical protein